MPEDTGARDTGTMPHRRALYEYYFTMASKHVREFFPEHEGTGCIRVIAQDYEAARRVMVAVFGMSWAFQYEHYSQMHVADRSVIHTLAVEPPERG